MKTHPITSAPDGFRALAQLVTPATVCDLGSGPRHRWQAIWPEAQTRHFDAHPYEGVEPIDLSRPLELPPCDVVTMLDVIEHLETHVGWDRLEEARRHARMGVVIATPYGYVPQHSQIPEDVARPNPHQEHVSGWWPADLMLAGASDTWECYPRAHGTPWQRGGWLLAWLPC